MLVCFCLSFLLFWILPSSSLQKVFNAAFFIFTVPPLSDNSWSETQRDKDTLCDTRASPTVSRPQKSLERWEIDKRHHSNPLGEYEAQSTVDLTSEQPAAIVSRGVGVEGSMWELEWVRDDHRHAVIYLCWLEALSSSAWVAHWSIIHQTDD